MATRAIRIVIEGATGRLGSTQHLRSLMAISSEGGLPLVNGDRLVPEPVLLGRNPQKLAALAAMNGGLKWSTDRDACLADPEIAIYFDATATGGRQARVSAALDAGKHVYVEKPLAETLADALDLARRAERSGRKNGVVQDKLFLPELRDETGNHYRVDVEDTAFAIFELADGVLAQVSSSWASRVKRDDLLQIQVDGTRGSALCGLHRCFIQPLAATPKPFFDPERPQPMVFDEQWQEMPDVEPLRNGYRAGWELFLRHVAEDAPFPSPFREGAKTVQLAEACHQRD